jgi:hypothetical protein
MGNYVSLEDNEDIDGVKTFSSIPVLPSTTPTNDNHAVSLKTLNSVLTAKVTAMFTLIGDSLYISTEEENG